MAYNINYNIMPLGKNVPLNEPLNGHLSGLTLKAGALIFY